MVATPRDAATVVLMREVPGIDTRPEVLMLKRHDGDIFGANAYVFPGGMVEAADSIPAALILSQYVLPEAAAAMLGDGTPPPEALGFWIGALRETFEETGILLARLANGDLWNPNPAEAIQIAGQRRALNQGTAPFATIMHDLERPLATDMLVYFAHWITPEANPIRFSTRFFFARVPSTLEVQPDKVEVVEHVWISPEVALQRHANNEMKMFSVTVKILQTLSQYTTARAAEEQLRYIEVQPVLPKHVVLEDGSKSTLYPGDEGYE